MYQWFNELPTSDEAKDHLSEPAKEDSSKEENCSDIILMFSDNFYNLLNSSLFFMKKRFL